MSLARPRYPHGQRPYGTLGRKVMVTVNAYEVKQIKPKDLYIYDVSIGLRGKPNIPDLLVKTNDNKFPLTSQRAHEIVDKMKFQHSADWAGMTTAYDGRKLLVCDIGTFDRPTGFTTNMSAKKVDDNDNTGVFIVTVTPVLMIDGRSYNQLVNGSDEDDNCKTFIQALQLLLRMGPILGGGGGTPHNSRSVFTPDGRRPAGAFELWRGIFQSVRPSIGKLIVNVDMVAAYVYTPDKPVIDFITQALNARDARFLERLQEDSDDWKMIKTLIKRLLVYATVPKEKRGLPPRRRPIVGLVEDIRTFMFDWEINSQKTERVSVYDYFLRVHGVTPTFKLGLQFGSNRRPIVIPAQYCKIAGGQLYKRALTADQTTAMLNFTKLDPPERIGRIQEAVTGSFLNYNQSPYLLGTGLQISEKPIQAHSRMLERPSIEFANNVVDNPQMDTSWRIMNKTFVAAGQMSYWAVVNFSAAPDEQAMRFAQEIQGRCVARGMDVRGLTSPVVRGNNQSPTHALDSAYAQYVGQPLDAQRQKFITPLNLMILVVLPSSNRGGEQRKAVKLWGDCLRGVVTQCMKEEKLRQQRGQIDQYCNNMAIKINAKLGGTNSLPRSPPVAEMLEQRFFMVFGADVGHPGPGVTDRPSICSLTASIDAHAVRYITRAFIQSPRQETMDPDKLEVMFYDCLLAFAKKNGMVPMNILFYRDGVSEGEFDRVSHFEVPAIEKGWKRFWIQNFVDMRQGKVKNVPQDASLKEFCPPLPITFVVVGKRHHFKFFPGQGTRESDRKGNALGGLVVDRDIVSPTTLDFYLQSHGGLLGTSRSAHYTVLTNTTRGGQGISIDQLQAVSHYLCYAYARATRAVSIPAPVYYADLICARARFHLNDNGQPFSDGGSGTFDQNYWDNIFKEVHAAQRNRPFFM